MVTAVSTGNVFSPNFKGLGTGVSPSASLSQYLEEGSVFSNVGMGMNPAMGFCAASMINPNMYNNMAYGSDMSTSLAFVNRGNQHALASYNEIMMKNMPELAAALRNGEYGKAGKIYDEVYEAIAMNYGREITSHQDRLNMEQSIKATINQSYIQINGSTIAMDSAANKESYFENGFMQGLTMGNHHRNCSEEIESYMTGTRVEGYTAKSLSKSIGRFAGSAVNVGAFVGAGAAIGAACSGGMLAVPGAVVGGIVGLVVNAASWLFSDNQPSKVTKA